MTCRVGTRELGRAAYGDARISEQRLVIAAVVESSAERAFSSEMIAQSARRASPGIGLATVYRAIAAMQTAGFIEPVGERDGAVLYARCSHDGHHHHLMCTGCGAVAHAECPVKLQAAPDDSGFRVTGHNLVLYGLCPSCQQIESQPSSDQQAARLGDGLTEKGSDGPQMP